MATQEQLCTLARELGWQAEAVSAWRKGGAVPQSARWRLHLACLERGIPLLPDDFDGWRTTRGPRAPPRPGTAAAGEGV